MRVFNVLDPAFKMKGLLFLEAAAGCGKTFAIEHIVARLLIEEEIEFEKCLIVTFTKAAAIDLKKRIFATLIKIEEAILSGDYSLVNLPYLEPLFTNRNCLVKVQQAIETSNFAMISTIHGFCLNFLTENAYFVDLPLTADLEIELIEWIKDALRSLPKDLFPSIWLKQFIGGLDTIDEAIIKTIYPHLGLTLATDQKVSFQEHYKKFITLFIELKNNLKTADFSDFFECFIGFNGLYDRDKQFKYEKEKKALIDLFYLDIPSMVDFENFLDCRYLIEKIDISNL